MRFDPRRPKPHQFKMTMMMMTLNNVGIPAQPLPAYKNISECFVRKNYYDKNFRICESNVINTLYVERRLIY